MRYAIVSVKPILIIFLVLYLYTWNKDDVDCISEIIKERENFSLNRIEI